MRNGCRGNPLAGKLNSAGWPTLFPGDNSDAIVPDTSQLNGGTGTLGAFGPAIHSVSLEDLDFSGPGELEPGSGIPDAVVDRLNYRTDDPVFQQP